MSRISGSKIRLLAAWVAKKGRRMAALPSCWFRRFADQAAMAAVGSPSNVSRSDRSTTVAISRRRSNLVPSRVDRRHAFARVREQRADLFERIARPVQDRCGGAPKVVRRPSLHREPGNKALSGFVKLMAVKLEDRRVRIGLEMPPQQFLRQAREWRDERAVLGPCRRKRKQESVTRPPPVTLG